MITRPALRYHGGKWRLAPWIIEHFPPHRVYTEPFGGAASVLLRKPRSYSEVYNDLDGETVNLFRALRSERAEELVDALRLTPYARAEFEAAYEPSADPVERARRAVIRSYMGFSTAGMHRPSMTGFRANSNRSHTTPAHDWRNYPDALAAIIDRLRGVVIEQRPALDVLRQHDGPDTLHYVDPPYLHETRSQNDAYDHEMTAEQHAELLDVLDGLEGDVILSGYPNDLYAGRLRHWRCERKEALADGAQPRVECLWIRSGRRLLGADARHIAPLPGQLDLLG